MGWLNVNCRLPACVCVCVWMWVGGGGGGGGGGGSIEKASYEQHYLPHGSSFMQQHMGHGEQQATPLQYSTLANRCASRNLDQTYHARSEV